jgi:predicted phage-related endonuclease
LYFSVLDAYSFKDVSPSEQIIIEQISWSYCKLQDLRDTGRLFSANISTLDDEGKDIITMADKAAKQEEYALVPALQSQLIKLISALRETQKVASKEDPHDLAALFGQYARQTE